MVNISVIKFNDFSFTHLPEAGSFSYLLIYVNPGKTLGICSQNGTLIRQIHTVIRNSPTLIGQANFLLSSSFILISLTHSLSSRAATCIRKYELKIRSDQNQNHGKTYN
jgi:hypothetical protein